MGRGGEGEVVDPEALVARLTSADGRMRREAHEALVSLGAVAVEALSRATTHGDSHVRGEIAQTLAEIADPAAAAALARLLEDEESGVRWAAAEGFVALRRSGLPTLLQTLVDRSEHGPLRESAHHALTRLKLYDDLRELLSPVLAALESAAPAEEASVAAYKALRRLR